jgi:CRISPR system Cascade subunit CasA
MITSAFIVIPVTREDGGADLSLPDVLAGLVRGDVTGFPGLAAHQRSPWHLFLAQVAALAMSVAGRPADDLPIEGESWAGMLAALTPGTADTAWRLIVDDVSKPALLQPPVKAGDLAAHKKTIGTPDALDLLVTAKNHDVKMARAAGAAEHLWLYALVSLQTFQGYSGRGNFGVARMNGGFASRPLVELVPGRDWPSRFRRAVAVAMAAREAELAEVEGRRFARDGAKLLWTVPWDEDEPLPLLRLDPLFVEVCRRIRLVRAADGGIRALFRASEAARVAAKDAKGALGDPWIPLNLRTQGALTLTGDAVGYEQVARILTDRQAIEPCRSMRPLESDRDDERMWFHVSVLVRGQGKTEGLHERWLPVRPRLARLAFGERWEAVNAFAQEMIENTRDGALRPLRAGLAVLLAGGVDLKDAKSDDPRIDPWTERLRERIDEVFFHHLDRFVASIGDDDATQAARAEWQRTLADLARTAAADAMDALSPGSARAVRARAVAENVLLGMVRKNLPDARQPETEEAA